MLQIKIALVTEDEELVQMLKKYESDSLQIEHFTEAQALHQKMLDHPYNGMVIDLMKKLKLSVADRKLISNEFENFPIFSIRKNPKEKVLKGLDGSTFEDFIDKKCRNFVPRKIRSDVRRQIHLHAEINQTGYFGDNDYREKTITYDISRGGYFVFTTQEWKMQDTVWIRFHEFPEIQPLAGIVQWISPWGRGRKIPGIGIRFTDLTDDQVDEVINTIFIIT